MIAFAEKEPENSNEHERCVVNAWEMDAENGSGTHPRKRKTEIQLKRSHRNSFSIRT